jgi:hypothetical protein
MRSGGCRRRAAIVSAAWIPASCATVRSRSLAGPHAAPYQSDATVGTTLGSRSARLHLGSHPVADELRDLDLSSAPLLALDIPQCSLIPNPPDAKLDVRDWRDPRGGFTDEHRETFDRLAK